MKLFVVGSGIPCGEDRQPWVSAVNVVQLELIEGLRALGHDITYQPLLNPFQKTDALSPEERSALTGLGERGVATLEPIFPSEYVRRERAWWRWPRKVLPALGGTRLAQCYPSIRVAPLVADRVRRARADAVLTLWSPEGVAATHAVDVPRVAYHGDIDFQTEQARRRDHDLFGSTAPWFAAPLAPLRDAIAGAEYNRAHWAVMKRVSVIANVTACNAEHYTRLGHRRSVYVRNTWPDRAGRAGMRPPRGGSKIRIIGHAGSMSTTGSTYGLRFLLQDVLPGLRSSLRGLDYQVEILGGGRIAPPLQPLLSQERIVVRGFVPDLTSALEGADAVLMCNNAGPYQAAFTRHLVAWSSGHCLIVHRNSVLAIPEIEPGVNALAGSTGEEVAAEILRAVSDRALNQRVCEAGRATYERFFTPAHVAAALDHELRMVT